MGFSEAGLGHLGASAAMASAVGTGAYFGGAMNGARTYPASSTGRQSARLSSGRLFAWAFREDTCSWICGGGRGLSGRGQYRVDRNSGGTWRVGRRGAGGVGAGRCGVGGGGGGFVYGCCGGLNCCGGGCCHIFGGVE